MARNSERVRMKGCEKGLWRLHNTTKTISADLFPPIPSQQYLTHAHVHTHTRTDSTVYHSVRHLQMQKNLIILSIVFSCKYLLVL